jgi:hypothetical protein
MLGVLGQCDPAKADGRENGDHEERPVRDKKTLHLSISN